MQTSGDMLALVDQSKVAPVSCLHGCAQWSTLNKTAIWAGGVAPSNAKNSQDPLLFVKRRVPWQLHSYHFRASALCLPHPHTHTTTTTTTYAHTAVS